MITINELFSGLGAQIAAFKRLNIPCEVVGISEIDKYAIQSYEAINGPTRNYGDITQIPYLDYADLWTYSSPCQDFSTAGKQKGIYNADGSLTRSGLLKHVERLLETSVMLGNQPKYLLMENVKGLVSKKFKPDFLKWLDKLEQLGYNNYWQVLNAKDYGIPQNRERVFVVSIRKDVDTKGYKFPSPVPLEKRLKDMLEPWVDVKYYLSDDKVEKFANALNKKIENQDISYCIDANYWKGTTPQQFLNKNRRQLVKEVSNTIRCGGGGSLDGKHTWDVVVEPFIADDTQGFDGVRYYDNYSLTLRSERSGLKVVEPLQIKEATQKGYAEAYEYDSVSLDQPNSKTRRGRVGKQISNTLTCSCNMGVVEPKVIQVGNIVNTGNWDNPQRGRIYSPSGISPALNTVGGGGLEPKIFEEGVGLNPLSRKLEFNGFKENSPSLRATDYKCPHCYSDGYRIRKLTARECWRLMGFTDIEFDCAKLSGVSNSQLYRQAGNSIVVDVLVGIFKELFDDRF
jgi:DNA (cytosine-5)-methyltransferase 1